MPIDSLDELVLIQIAPHCGGCCHRNHSLVHARQTIHSIGSRFRRTRSKMSHRQFTRHLAFVPSQVQRSRFFLLDNQPHETTLVQLETERDSLCLHDSLAIARTPLVKLARADSTRLGRRRRNCGWINRLHNYCQPSNDLQVVCSKRVARPSQGPLDSHRSRLSHACLEINVGRASHEPPGARSTLNVD